ncbi:MAG: hypothetical protein CBB79_09955 [Synechococcus sp. TMED19]|nr:MAG: hypothetical protein CBB79_09955 [Synechococcus sp. TMED19]
MNPTDGGATAVARRELQSLEQLSDKAACKLYQLVAAYAADLRLHLEPLLLQAVFQLCTRQLPQAFNAMSEEHRRELRERIHDLCQRCSCLLTVEQLAQLALRLDSADQDDETEEPDEPDPGDDVDIDLPIPSTDPAAIELSLDPPRFLGDFDPSSFCPSPSPPSSEDDEPGDEIDANEAAEAIDLLRQMVHGAVITIPSRQSNQPPQAFPLPRDPAGLRRWFHSWDRALQRRLRNLSHAVNLELMRSGLCRSLIPLTLLDAALEGQTDLQAAPPNVLSVQMPLLDPVTSEELRLNGVLLRVAEYEHLRPELRNHRRQLHQLEATLLRMERRMQHWHQRLAVLQAQSLWLEDSSDNPSPRL